MIPRVFAAFACYLVLLTQWAFGIPYPVQERIILDLLKCKIFTRHAYPGLHDGFSCIKHTQGIANENQNIINSMPFIHMCDGMRRLCIRTNVSNERMGIMGEEQQDKRSAAQRLGWVQRELKAPKGQMNAFGNYKYRSCEDILEAVKPLVHTQGCYLTISDEVVMLGERFYVKATATFTSAYDEHAIEVSSYAREALVKKGMDEAQITGSASSYARKYALNGLFAIDDTKDPDTKDNREAPQAKRVSAPSGNPGDYVITIGKKYKGQKLSDVKNNELESFAEWLENSAKESGKPLSGPGKEFVSMVEKYLGV